jgi:hypothetical protein
MPGLPAGMAGMGGQKDEEAAHKQEQMNQMKHQMVFLH